VDAVLVPVGPDLYAVPIGWVREVVSPGTLTPLATAPPKVLGLFNLRGEIVPLLDSASLLGVGRTGSVMFAVVLQTALGPVGLSAEAFPRRSFLDEPIGPSELPDGVGCYRVDGQVAVLLDIQGLLDSMTAAERIDAPDLPSAAVVRES
jgi:purine-binding chemotaxis protein CheW